MLPKIIGNEVDVETFKCGYWWRLFDRNGSRLVQFFCKKWSCAECRRKKINELSMKIYDSLNTLGGVHLFIRSVNIHDNKLKNFLSKNVQGYWWALRLNNNETMIISTRIFPNAIRRSKQKFLTNDLHYFLDNVRHSGKPISCSYGVRYFINKTHKLIGNQTQRYLAKIPFCEDWGFDSLTTDEERAVRLFQLPIENIFKAGLEFIARHYLIR